MTEEVVTASHFDGDGSLFEQQGRSNGGKHWSARKYMAMLGYDNYDAFEIAINKAIGTCTTLGISVAESFIQITTVDGLPDYELSRFACYLVAMNGDVRKPNVAAAQAYFASLAEAARLALQDANDIERVQIRGEISEREKGLSRTAHLAGVTEYGLFQNAGYRGMYNMDLSRLKKRKGMPSDGKTLLDYMDKRELAGNLFRVTETDAKLTAHQIKGQHPAESVAHDVGKQVREMMIANTGTKPEDIPLAGDIRQSKKGLKDTFKHLFRMDTPKALKPKK